MIEKWVAGLFVIFFGIGVAIGALWSASETADKIIGLLDDIRSKLSTLLAETEKQRLADIKMEGELKLLSAMVRALASAKNDPPQHN